MAHDDDIVFNSKDFIESLDTNFLYDEREAANSGFGGYSGKLASFDYMVDVLGEGIIPFFGSTGVTFDPFFTFFNEETSPLANWEYFANRWAEYNLAKDPTLNKEDLKNDLLAAFVQDFRDVLQMNPTEEEPYFLEDFGIGGKPYGEWAFLFDGQYNINNTNSDDLEFQKFLQDFSVEQQFITSFSHFLESYPYDRGDNPGAPGEVVSMSQFFKDWIDYLAVTATINEEAATTGPDGVKLSSYEGIWRDFGFLDEVYKKDIVTALNIEDEIDDIFNQFSFVNSVGYIYEDFGGVIGDLSQPGKFNWQYVFSTSPQSINYSFGGQSNTVGPFDTDITVISGITLQNIIWDTITEVKESSPFKYYQTTDVFGAEVFNQFQEAFKSTFNAKIAEAYTDELTTAFTNFLVSEGVTDSAEQTAAINALIANYVDTGEFTNDISQTLIIDPLTVNRPLNLDQIIDSFNLEFSNLYNEYTVSETVTIQGQQVDLNLYLMFDEIQIYDILNTAKQNVLSQYQSLTGSITKADLLKAFETEYQTLISQVVNFANPGTSSNIEQQINDQFSGPDLTPSEMAAVTASLPLDNNSIINHLVKGFRDEAPELADIKESFNRVLAEFAKEMIDKNGYFIPSQFFDEWAEKIQQEAFRIGFVSSVYNPNINSAEESAASLLIIDRLIRLFIEMVAILQSISASQANRIRFLTIWQEKYTDMITDATKYIFKEGDPNYDWIGSEDAQTKRTEINTETQAIIDTIRTRRSVVQDDAKQMQTTVNSSQDAANQQTQFGTALIQQMTTILAQIFR